VVCEVKLHLHSLQSQLCYEIGKLDIWTSISDIYIKNNFNLTSKCTSKCVKLHARCKQN